MYCHKPKFFKPFLARVRAARNLVLKKIGQQLAPDSNWPRTLVAQLFFLKIPIWFTQQSWVKH